ncbi:MAG: N-acetylglucosamine-6-phosphate deacetylase [Cohaesibacter sp.]|nr:N-acetylglucosamine-6-phosphate deacetylase [Cohaesibacter sp.]
MKQLLRGARLFTGTEFLDHKAVSLIHGRIDAVLDEPVNGSDSCSGWDQVHDLDGLILCPGFIDVQVNGGGGIMINGQTDLTDLETMAVAHRAYGTTTLLPTLISDGLPAMRHVAALIKACLARVQDQAEAGSLAAMKGVHFEGPYLNPMRKGVHKQEILRAVDDEALGLFCDPELGIRLVTLAPEITGPDFIKALNEAGVLVCAGHTAANYQQIIEALDYGLRGFTHLFNAMTPMNSREPGVVGAALQDEASWCGLIVDGFHVHPAMLSIAIDAKKTGKMMLVTDAMACVGAEDKSFDLYDMRLQAKDGKCQTQDGTLAGSDLDMIGAVKKCVSLLDLPLEEALRMASLYPAHFIGQEANLGAVQPGFQADLVAFDEQSWSLAHSWIGGHYLRH